MPQAIASNHDQPERLRPADLEQERDGIAEKVGLLRLVNLTNELNVFAVDQWAYLVLEIRLIDFVDLRSDL